MTSSNETPNAVPPWQLPDTYFADWNPLVVNEYIRRLSRENQLSLALAAVDWAADATAPESPLSDYLAGIKDDLAQALQLGADPDNDRANPPDPNPPAKE